MKEFTEKDLDQGMAFQFSSFLYDDPVILVIIEDDSTDNYRLMDIDRFKVWEDDVLEFLNSNKVESLGVFNWLELKSPG